MGSSQREAVREALKASSGSKDKGPAPVHGVLSADPDAGGGRSTMSHCDSLASTSASLESNDDCQPADLYGKYTWKIANFTDMKKKELRSNAFIVGSCKWYILMYPTGCDACNQLSLFLCVADYDKLLPGWSHFAQFTISVVNKDPKKSKYSDTLHRFTKKEHDWGWKRFMELSKVQDGFAYTNDTLVIRAQVQVVRDQPSTLFRCLDPRYRRELARVYLSTVEGICRHFVEERRDQLQALSEQLPALQDFWARLSAAERAALSTERSGVISKGIVKHFFNDKEVTSTLVMDALFIGYQQTEDGAAHLNGCKRLPAVLVDAKGQALSLNGDVLVLLSSAAAEELPLLLHEKVAPLARAEAQSGTASSSTVQDEQRLAELGRRSVEMHVLSHIFLEKIAVAFREAEAIRRQEALIREEEQHAAESSARAALKTAVERERKARRKERKQQAKQAAERAQEHADSAGAAAAGSVQRGDAARQCPGLPTDEAEEHGAARAAATAANGDPAAPVSAAQQQPSLMARAASATSSVQSADFDRSAGGSLQQDTSQMSLESSATSTRCRIMEDADDLHSTSSSVRQLLPTANLQAAAQVAELRARVAALEAQLRGRDETIAALRGELAAAAGAPPAPATPPPAGPARRLPAAAAAADAQNNPAGPESPIAFALRGGSDSGRRSEHCNGGGLNGVGGCRDSSGSAKRSSPSPSSSIGVSCGRSSCSRSSGGSAASFLPASCPGSRTGSHTSSLDTVFNPELATQLRSGTGQLPPISRSSTGDLRLHSSSDSSGSSALAERAASAGWDRPVQRPPNGSVSRMAHASLCRQGSEGHVQQQGAGWHACAKPNRSGGKAPAARPGSRVPNGHTSAFANSLPAGKLGSRSSSSSHSVPSSYLQAVVAAPKAEARGAAARASSQGLPLPAAANGCAMADSRMSDTGSDDSSFAALADTASARPAVCPAFTPLSPPTKMAGLLTPLESPGLDGFAHMGLITELLE